MGYFRITPRQEAKAAGRPTYQGKPCSHGHSGIRRTCNGHCVECDKQEKRDNVEYYVAYSKAWREKSPEHRERARQWVKTGAIRNAAKIEARRLHRRAIVKNTLRLLYYE